MKSLVKFSLFILVLSPFSFVYNNGIHTDVDYVFAVDGVVNTGGVVSNSIQLENPLKKGGIEDIPTFVEKLLGIVMKVGVPLVAVAIIYTGYLFIAAQGNPEKLKIAKDAILYVFIGAIILLGAYVIAQALQGTINSIRGN